MSRTASGESRPSVKAKALELARSVADLGFDDLGFDDLGFDDLGFGDLGDAFVVPRVFLAGVGGTGGLACVFLSGFLRDTFFAMIFSVPRSLPLYCSFYNRSFGSSGASAEHVAAESIIAASSAPRGTLRYEKRAAGVSPAAFSPLSAARVR